MTIDERLRGELAVLADQVRPADDPLGRLLARDRRRRVRLTAAGAAAVAVLLVGVAVLVAAGTRAAIRPADSPTVQEWTRRLLDAAPRGALGQQQAFFDGLTSAVTDRLNSDDVVDSLARAGTGPTSPTARDVRVLFADDIGGARVAAVALVPDDGVRPLPAEALVAWLVGPAGASPATLAQTLRRTAPATPTIIKAYPFLTAELPGLTPSAAGPVVGLAPPECAVQTATRPAAGGWTPEPTGSYVVRSAADRNTEWWRVTCHGVLREQIPAPPVIDPASRATVTITDVDVSTALLSARGTPDRELAKLAVNALATQAGYELIAKPEVVWGGRAPGLGDAVIVAARTVVGDWEGELVTRRDGAPTNEMSATSLFAIPTDPREDTRLLAVKVSVPGAIGTVSGDAAPPPVALHILAVAPLNTASIRLVVAGQVLERKSLYTGGVTVFDSPPDTPDTRLEALDLDGVKVSTAVPLGLELITQGRIDNWGT
jgi:hypothetical protein